ncbi:mechanosensitive ion channel [Bacillus sp. P14.5]|uniref:mechanosensitive ion channel n=1 Tax=Bacillus sp. P14.5 TaxID=1983400 RepID=UPI000DE9138E|nr:mechanosensitive ion channel [Bacillus sp. P14.5]
MNNMNMYNFEGFLGKIPDFLLALVVLLIGWLVAKGVEKAVYKLLNRTGMDDKLFSHIPNKKYSSEKIISKIVYWILLLIVFIIVLNILNLNLIAEPLVNLMNSIFGAVDNILKAALILLVAYALAMLVSMGVRKLAHATHFDHLLVKWNMADTAKDAHAGINKAAKVLFYLVLLLFLPAVLSALDITGVSEPFTDMLNSMLAFIPKLLAAALIIFVGYFVAKLVRTIVTNFLHTIGLEKLGERLGLSRTLSGTSLSSIAGNIVFILILIPTVIAALEKLDIEGVSGPAIEMLNDVLTMLPNIAVAIVLILVGLWAGRIAGRWTTNFLNTLSINSLMSNMKLGSWKPGESTDSLTITRILGYVVHFVIALLFIVEALQIVELEFLVTLATGVFAYIPSVIAAIVILAVGLYLGNITKKVLVSILNGSSKNVLATIAKYAIIIMAFFMALDQLGIAQSIVNSAFILVLGGLSLAFGLSFGLGGREFASNYLSKMENNLSDISVDKEKAKRKAQESSRDDWTSSMNEDGTIDNQPNRPDDGFPRE